MRQRSHATTVPATLRYVALGCVALACLAPRSYAQIAVRNQGYVPFSDAPIDYRSNDLNDPVSRLEHQLETGQAHLVYEPQHGYLRSVLQSLRVPVDSQTLVFSKTSFQYPKISPEHPRALYFNDDVYVGSVHEGKAIEIVSFDPMQGAIFYLLDEQQAEKPRFQRAELDCTQCHIAAGTRGIPGVLLRSVYPTPTGTLVSGTKAFITDQESPWSERWGGWYVTGGLVGGASMGNSVVGEAQPVADTPSSAKLQPLPKAFDSSTYLSPDSDVVAHLVLAHQTQMHNLITLTNYKTRLALYAEGGEAAVSPSTLAASDAPLSDTTRRQIERPAEQLLRYMLFSNEAALPGGSKERVGASSAFAKEFSARGPRDSQGRSLRDLDLGTRIFRYPCSYLIYSDAFDALPGPAKGYVYHRLLEVLSGRDQSPEFARLTAADRGAILEILLATKRGLPDEWKSYAASRHLQVAEAVSPSNPAVTHSLRSNRSIEGQGHE